MKVVVMKKATVTDIPNGHRYSTDVDTYNNATSVAEDTVSDIGKIYVVTETDSGTSATHQYSQADYIVNIMP